MIHIRKLLFVCNIRAIYGYAQSTFNQHKFSNFSMLKISSKRAPNLSKNLMKLQTNEVQSVALSPRKVRNVGITAADPMLI